MRLSAHVFAECVVVIAWVLAQWVMPASGASLSVLTEFVRDDNTYVAPSGAFPSKVTFDSAGNLFGTTNAGGVGCTLDAYTTGCGTVFKLSPPASGQTLWSRTILYKFKGGIDGFRPNSQIAIGPDGSIYGTTFTGGIGCRIDVVQFYGCGTVFKLSPPVTGKTQWRKSVLYYFKGNADGQEPDDIALGTDGKLYGITSSGGATCSGIADRCGTVFRLSPPAGIQTTWMKTSLYTFKGDDDGRNPSSIIFRGGVLYGIVRGGTRNRNCNNGCGAIFRLRPPIATAGGWKKDLLYVFKGGADGERPYNLIFDRSGNLFGAASIVGRFGTPCYYVSCSYVFKLAKPSSPQSTWTKTVLKGFAGDGLPDFTFGADSAIYGFMTGGEWYQGKYFRLTLGGQLNALYNFTFDKDDLKDQQSPVFGRDGKLYGVNPGGSRTSDGGSVFAISTH